MSDSDSKNTAENENSGVDVNKIMLDIQKKVAAKMNNPEYAKDIKRLEKISIKRNEGIKMYDLFSLTMLEKRLTIPRSTRGGVISKLMNVFFVKLYYVVYKMIEPVLNVQERFNRAILENILKIEETLGKKTLEAFPYQAFFDSIDLPKENKLQLFENFKDKIENQKRVLCLQSRKGEFLEFAKENGVKEIYGFEPNSEFMSFSNSTEFEIKNKELLDAIAEHNRDEFDAIFLNEVSEYYQLDYTVSLFRECMRTLKANSYVVVMSKDPESLELGASAHDPKIVKLLHKEIILFLLEYFGFVGIEEISLDKSFGRYVLVAKKA